MRLWTGSALCLGILSAALCACSDSSDKDKASDPAVEADAGAEGDAGDSCTMRDKDVGAVEESAESHPGDADKSVLPIVFVHGFAGSASQFDSQAQRFVANGYPPNKLYAYDHDGSGVDIAGYADGLDKVIDDARSKWGTSQVILIGHSRGTSVSNTYLGNPERAKKVSKVVLLDGRPCATDGSYTLPCDAPNKMNLGGQRHVEVATSAESFKRQYKFLFGKDAQVADITREGDRVRISGRAVNFPANTGRDGATLRVYEVDDETGERLCDKEIASFEIGASGEWGPLQLSPDHRYEFTLGSKDSGAIQHFYPQRFLRSTKFVRLLSGPPDSPSRVNSNFGPNHTALTVLRMREWTSADVLKITERSESGDVDLDNVLTPAVTQADDRIALYLQDDAATPKKTTNELIPYFPSQPFQTGADIYLPASDPPNGVITLTNLPRGDASKPQVLSFPNWPSENHTVMVLFNDFAL